MDYQKAWEELKKWVDDRNDKSVHEYESYGINKSILSGQCMELQSTQRKMKELESGS